MASPALKLYSARTANKDAEYVASAKYYEDAAAFVAILGEGATVRINHKIIVWTEGAETQSAAASYDEAAFTMRSRHIAYQRAAYEKHQKAADNARAIARDAKEQTEATEAEVRRTAIAVNELEKEGPPK
jgi:hypothetical protein